MSEEVERIARLMHATAIEWAEKNPGPPHVGRNPFDGLTEEHRNVYRAVAAGVIAELTGPVIVVRR